MKFKPIYKFRGTTIMRAFIINAFLAAIIAAFTIEIRRVLDEHDYTKMWPSRPHKVLITITASFCIGLVSYSFLRFFSGTGESMMEGAMLKHFWN
jgi:hypothetical protein